MMVTKFQDFKYERPDFDLFSTEVDGLLNAFKKADSLESQQTVIDQFNEKIKHIYSMVTIATIRSSIDTKDKFYLEEREFFDKNLPVLSAITNDYYEELLNSPFRKELEELYGKQLFSLVDNKLKGFDPKIKDLMSEINALSSKYSILLSSAEINYDGKTLALTEFAPYMINDDREVRKAAIHAKQQFMKEHLDEIDEIYDELVKKRHKMAVALGYNNYTELGYIHMDRIDYDRNMVENYRQQVKDYVVPYVTELRKRQKERIGVEDLNYYDLAYEFKSGNPTPKGGTKAIMENGAKMYKELSKETDEFYTFMSERNLFDVEAKKGKEGGGYCTFIEDYKAPFIFSNFNGTQGDIEVLTHEAGHAFQMYSSRNFSVPEYIMPTHEACEIHSMSMEFFTYPWMELFFEEETDKFKFSHLAGALEFLPYGVAIDEFQHVVYDHPELTPKERREEWKKIEAVYLPDRDYEDIPGYVDGAFWHGQGHLFGMPFYYIDYTLAQVCALQFFKRANEDFDNAFNDYLALCKLGGSLPFGELVKAANLKSPFEDGTLKEIVEYVKTHLDNIDDKNL